MRIPITSDIPACVAAGVEPADSVEVDLAALPPEDRAALAAALAPGQYPLTAVPTVAGVVAAAHARAQQRAADEAAAAEVRRRAATRDAEHAAQVAALVARVRARVPETVRCEERFRGRHVEWTMARSGVPPYAAPAEVHDELAAWDRDLTEESRRNRDAAIAPVLAEIEAARAVRAVQPIADLVAALPGGAAAKLAPLALDTLEDDDGEAVTLSGPSRHPRVRLVRRVRLHDGDVTALARVEGDDEDTRPTARFALADSVLDMPHDRDASQWAARVADPAAPKPVYEFLRRCPGGYQAPALAPGDVLVWGGKDRRGRKDGPHDRLVYAVADDAVLCLRVDYVTARRLRKILVGV